MFKVEKICTACGILKPREAFYPKSDKSKTWAVTGKCRECLLKRAKAKRLANPKPRKPRKVATLVRERVLLYAAKQRARHNRLPFNLTLEDITIPAVCPVLGIPLYHGVGKAVGDNSPSLDRLKPSLGYTKGNVAVMSHKANRIKNDATSAEVFLVANWMALRSL